MSVQGRWRIVEMPDYDMGEPAYIVFGDATLRGVALARPSSLDELGTISGIGQKKLDTYGAALLEVVAAGD